MSEHTSTDGIADRSDSPAIEKKASWWEDFIDIFYTPSTVFARRAKSGFGLPMIVITLAIAGLFYVNYNAVSSMMEAEFTRNMEKAAAGGAQIKPEMVAQMHKMFEISSKIGTFIMIPVIMFLIGLTLWVLGKFVGAKQTLTAAIMVAAFSYAPRILEGVATSIQALLLDTSTLTGRYQLSLGVGRFLPPETTSSMLMTFLGRIDVFTIWVTILLAIGIRVTGGISARKAAIVGVGMWLVGAAFTVLSVARQG